jgi:hypothetical protein
MDAQHLPLDPWSVLADRLVRGRWLLLVAAALLTVAGLGPASRLQFDQSIESFYAPDNPHLKDYLESKGLFGGDEFVVVAFADPELFTEDRLSLASANRIRQFAEDLSRVPGVDPTSTQNLADALALDRLPMLATQRENLRKLFEGILLGEDRQTTAILLRLVAQSEAPAPRRQTIDEIRRVAAEFPLPTYIVGEPVQINDTFLYIEQDGTVLGWASTGLLVLVILLIFRRLRWVVLPVLVVEIAIVWTKALLVVGGFQLSMVSSVMNSLMLVVGIATVMHVIVRYRECRERSDPAAAARETFRQLAHPVFWTTVTTAAGFAAQITSHVNPVQSFGWMMGIGTMVLLVAVATILPGGILVGGQSPMTKTSGGDGPIQRLLRQISGWSEHAPRRVAAVALLILVASVSGMFRLHVETDFSRNFRATTPIVKALEFVETRLGGAGVWEVHFPAPAELDSQYLERVRSVADRLRGLEIAGWPAATKVISLTDGTDLVPLLPLPAKRALLRQVQPEFEESLFNPEQGRMRLVLRARERQQSDDRLNAITEVGQLARAEFPHAKTTGLFVLLTYLVESLLDDQWVSFAVGATMIITLMSIAFRSLRLGLVSLVPNLLPIVFAIGAMGWLGVPINLGTAMISSVSMGLTVDSSIHYFSSYRRARHNGLDVAAALRETNQGVGTALVYTNLALITGFLALTFSNFMPLIYFGLLVSVAMLGGLIGNLLFLPLLIRGLRIE